MTLPKILPCFISHWSGLSTTNHLAMQGWVSNYRNHEPGRGGPCDFFLSYGKPFIHGLRPTERAAVVLLGNAYPKHEGLIREIKAYYYSKVYSNTIAAVYALGPQFVEDEDLRDRFMLRLWKLRDCSQFSELKNAIGDVLHIAETMDHDGRCPNCVVAHPATLELQEKGR